MKKLLHILLFVGLFLFSFALFLFLTFPYEVLKESLSAEIAQSTGFNVRIGEMGASLPLGIKAKDIKIENAAGNSSMTLTSMSANVSALSFLMGKVRAEAAFAASSGIGKEPGEMDITLDFGLLDLIKGEAMPRRFQFVSDKFPIDQLVAFALSTAASGPNANQMVAPLMTAIGITGALTGRMDFDLNSTNPTQSAGSMDVKLVNATLMLDHPSIGLQNQTFKTAEIKAQVKNGVLEFAKGSGFVSQELSILTDGKVALKAVPTASILDLQVAVQLDGDLKEKLGVVMDMATGKSAEGKVTMQVRGPMEQPNVQTF